MKTISGVWNKIAKLFTNTKIGGLPLRNYMKGEVCRGTEISFWLDPWAINEPLKLKFPELFRMESEKKCSVADRIRFQGLDRVLVWNWKSPMTDPGVISEFQQLLAVIETIQFTGNGDRWLWTPDKEGKFSVKAVKNLLHSDIATANGFVMDWCKWVPAKCNIHAWRLEMERIPTGEALKKRNTQIGDSVCPLCFSAEESSLHLFTGCLVASNIWNGISMWCKIPYIIVFSIKDLLGIHKELRASERKKDAVQGIIMIACWSIWRARNKLIFSNKPIRIAVAAKGGPFL
ncbi:uncharacterized protein LOC110920362 [Helianthus annuus]|uniref:uncharacterized protein LOC110920362 n=1 Tax=Helianthus annuus TaxID=4232 RepID=UPI000B8EF567|nr:uncharacterized protein LOC110920362 [Helianthus annuus]